MFRKFLLFSAALLCGVSLSAQWQRTPNDTLKSVRVLPDGDVLFSIYAPEAGNVSLTGDIMPWGQKIVPEKQDNGVWTIRIPDVKPGMYRYHFVVDGVQVYDPKSETTTQNSALAVVEPDGEEFFSYDKDIPHGSMAVRSYYSSVIGETRTMRVWTPAGYEKNCPKLPVLYLIHGGGDTDTSWPTVGAAGEILDKLLAEGKMKPMIVVMPNGTIHTDDMQGEVPIFAEDMTECIIPFIESNYNVLTDKDSRAMAGLSMGGMETLETALKNIDMFSYVYVLSSSFAPGADPAAEAARLGVPENVDKINASFRQFVFTQGGPSDIAYQNGINTRNELEKLGVKFEYDEVEGGHSWTAWRQNLYDLAQRIFK